jgi:H+/Cl- antiporter ClcA
MSILIYFAAVTVSIILDWQSKRHRFELQMAYLDLGKEMPAPTPKLQTLECWLNIILGVILTILGGLMLKAFFAMLRHFPESPSLRQDWSFPGLIVTVGITLLILGIRALRERARFSRRQASLNH